MSELVTKPPKPPLGQSDLSQVLAHGPAMSHSFGRLLGGFLLFVAIIKVNRGAIGIGAAVMAVIAIATYVYRHFIQ